MRIHFAFWMAVKRALLLISCGVTVVFTFIFILFQKMLNHSVITVLLYALSTTFFLTYARSVKISSMETGVTRNVHTTVNHVIYGMARVIDVNITTRDKTVQVYLMGFFLIKLVNNDYVS